MLLDQRDEALRELLAQLALANLLALAVASAVGYRLARAALTPVERYRARADRVAAGETGVRLDVPDGPDDEISRLGHTLNGMLGAQERAAARQREFIDDASHELRTPLAALSGEVQLALRRPRTAEEYQAALRRIASDTDRLIELAEDLLVLGAQGGTTPAAQDIAVRPLLETARRRAKAQLPDAMPVEIRMPEHLLVRGDQSLLDRALGNLVDNAVRYGDGPVTLTATALTSHQHSVVVLAVHDQGAGIPTDFLPYAAQRFRRAHPSPGGGHGLGLSLVDAIVATHHGQLRVCSNGSHQCQAAADQALAAQPCAHPASGTTVSLFLPGAPGEP